MAKETYFHGDYKTLSAKSYPFTLSWSHYLILMRIKNEQERRFYEIETEICIP